MKKAFFVLASLMLCTILLFGCGEVTPTTGSPPPTTTTSHPPTTTTSAPPTSATTTAAIPRSILECPQGPPEAGTPKYGGNLVILYSNNPSNLGAPWLKTSSFDGHCTRYALESLTGLDARGMPVPQLAKTWVSDPTAKTITFTLREGVKFHDGSPFNAEAAYWCLDKFKNGENPYMKDVTKIEVLGEYQVRITLGTWDPLFVQGMCGGAGKMVSPTTAKKYIAEGKEKELMLYPVGTGPFKFVSYTTSVSVKYEKFNDYWQKGLPYLDKVQLNLVSDAMVALTSFKKGEAHYLYGVQTGDAAELRDAGNTLNYTLVTISGITGNTVDPDSIWNKKEFRQAVAYALDYKSYVNTAFDGLYPATNQLAVEGRQAWNSSIQGYPYNVAKAKSLLEPLGITPATPLTMEFVSDNDAQVIDLYTLCQNALAQVGINITLKPLNRTARNELANKGFDKSQLFNFTFSYNGFEMQWSTSAQSNLSSSRNQLVSVATVPGLDDLLNQAKAESDMAKRDQYYQQMNKLMIDDYCMFVPIFGLARFTAMAPSLHDFGFSNNTAVEFLPERAWLEQ